MTTLSAHHVIVELKRIWSRWKCRKYSEPQRGRSTARATRPIWAQSKKRRGVGRRLSGFSAFMAERIVDIKAEQPRSLIEPKKGYRLRVLAEAGRAWRSLSRAEQKRYNERAVLLNMEKTGMVDPLLQFVQDLESVPELELDSPFGLMDFNAPLGEALFENIIDAYNAQPAADRTGSFVHHFSTKWKSAHGNTICADTTHELEDRPPHTPRRPLQPPR